MRGVEYDSTVWSQADAGASWPAPSVQRSVTPDAVKVRRSGTDLVIDLGSGRDVLTIKDGLGSHSVELYKFENGTTWTLEDIRNRLLVGTDGVARVLDFGVAKAAGRAQTTKEGQIKGKLGYMPPEQLRGAAVSRQTDIYDVGVMFWELVVGQRPE